MTHNVLSTEFAGSELVGAVSTLYKEKTDTRFELALENAENWRDQGLPYVVVDASPEPWVAKAHEERGATVVRSQIGGIATQRQQGVRHAMALGAEKVVGHEPEKILMSAFSQEIADELDKHEVLVIGRTARALASLPTTQQRTEHMAGWVLEETHKLPADTLSGGRGFTRAGAEELMRYPSQEPGMNNWIYLYATPIDARNAGMSVGGIKVDLMHPEIMTAEEQGNDMFDRKRHDQFKLQLDYMLSRPDVDASARPIADAVVAALAGLSQDRTNEEFEAQLARLESRLVGLGYVPRESNEG